MNFNDAAIVSVKGSDYKIHFWYMSKDDAISLMNAIPLKEKTGIFFFYNISKMSETTYYQRSREVILDRAKDYYRNNRNELKVKATDKYRKLSEEEKDMKRQYGRNRYNNMSEVDKQRLNKRISKKLP